MEKNSKNYFIFAFEMAALAAAFFVALKKIDVLPVGPEGSSVGLASINSWVAKMLPYNARWYGITQIIGYVAIGVCVIFGFVGLIQWIQRKNIMEVDREIIILGLFYILVIALYFFFTKYAINYRPVILEGEGLESSFPSSHTMLVCCVFGAAIVVTESIVESDALRLTVGFISWILIAVMIVGRLISGVHWLTDIVAGVLISVSLVSLYHALVLMPERD